MIDLPIDIIHNLNKLGYDLISSVYLSGGDINEARRLKTHNGKDYFLKYNLGTEAELILSSEIGGLKLLRGNDLQSANPVVDGSTYSIPYLLLEWIETSIRKDLRLAELIVKMHRVTNAQYGLETDNYIGSLPQKNTWSSSFSEFYLSCRIEPQIKLARDNGFVVSGSLERFQGVIESEIPSEKPSLIHGDLWSGNLMDGPQGPVLVDPSVSYAHREMDLAMMSLFGGFSRGVFLEYENLFPLIGDWRQRSDLFQLYYLLVHLNLFGESYLSQVQSIFSRYLH